MDLSGHGWNLASLKDLEPVFQRIKATLTDLKMNNITASLDTESDLSILEYLATTFANAPVLKSVNCNENAIGTRGIACLKPLLLKTLVTDLHFEICGLAKADGATLRSILANPSVPRQLQQLSLGANQNQRLHSPSWIWRQLELFECKVASLCQTFFVHCKNCVCKPMS